MPKNPEKSQKTKPKKGKPVEIPVPKREDVESLLKQAAQPPRSEPK